MRLRTIGQLFDQVDPSPFGQQDLSAWAADYIVEYVKEIQAPDPCELVVILAEPPDARMLPMIGGAVRAYFTRQAVLRQRAVRRLMRRGFISLAIGVVFLATFLAFSRLVRAWLGDGTVATVLQEGTVIVGWVAMWRPIEIFLYAWWPIVGERRLYERLSRLDVRITDQVVVGASP